MTKEKKSNFIVPDISVEELSKALYQANIELQLKNEQLFQNKKNQDKIIANISHDLRSPVTSISNNIEYLLSVEKLSDDELRESLDLMNNKISQIMYLLEQILSLNKAMDLENSKDELVEIPINIYLDEYFYDLQKEQKYDDRKLDFIQDGPRDVSVLLYPQMFQRVLDNLFTNALKYSNTGDSITLGIDASKKNVVLIYVRDNGIGISNEDIQKIFMQTYTVEEARTPTSEKTSNFGLGLSIAQEIVLKHNGKIYCNSTLNKETTFFIELPKYV